MPSSTSVRMIRNLLRWCRISRDGDDAGIFPIQQVAYLGKVGNAVTWFPYGFHANVPADELAVLFSMGGNPEARAVLPGSPRERPKVVAGEVVVYHPTTGTEIHFRANGDLEIASTGDVTVTATNAKVTATATATVDGATVDLGGSGGPAVARVGDSVSGGVITSGSAKVNAV